jgi:hypothetical protein
LIDSYRKNSYFATSDLDHRYKDAYDLFVPHGRVYHKRASDGRVPQACISWSWSDSRKQFRERCVDEKDAEKVKFLIRANADS